MKFACDRCNTKYSIADEKVREKVLRIRCKSCGNVIAVQQLAEVAVAPEVPANPVPSVPMFASSGPAPRAPQSPQVEWHVSINGDAEGPLTLQALARRVASLGREVDVHVWNEHIDAWKPPRDVPEVAAALKALAPKPSMPPAPPAVVRPPLPPRLPAPQSAAAPVPRPAAAPAGLPKPNLGSLSAALRKPSSPAIPAVPVRSRLDEPSSPFEDSGDNFEEATTIAPLSAAMLAAAQGPALEPAVPVFAAPPKGARPTLSAPPPLAPPLRKEGSGLTGLEALDFGQSQHEGHLALTPPPMILDAASSPHARPNPFSVFDSPQTNGAASVHGAQTVPAPFFPPASDSGVVPLPGQSSQLSSLSRILGRPGFFARNPKAKVIVGGGVIASLLVFVVLMVLRDGAEKKVAAKLGNHRGENSVDAEERARLEAKQQFGDDDNPNKGSVRSVQGAALRRNAPARPVAARPAGAPGPAAALAPPPTALEPPPPAAAPPPSDETASVTKRFATAERKVAGPPKASSTATEPFDMDRVVAVVRRKENQDAVKICYDRALKRDTRLSGGRVTVSVTIGGTGTVTTVNVQAASDMEAVSSCIRDTVRRWRFPGNGEENTFEFPFVFQRES